MLAILAIPAFLLDSYTVRPNRQSVKVRLKNPPGGEVTIDEANWRPWSKDDTNLVGPIAPEAERRTLIYPTAPNGGSDCPIAKNGDLVTDRDGVEWIVQNYRKELEGADVHCPCIRNPK